VGVALALACGPAGLVVVDQEAVALLDVPRQTDAQSTAEQPLAAPEAWSTELPERGRTLVALSALGISVVAAVLSAAPLAGSLPLLASGVGAVFVMIAIVVTIVWRVEGRRQ
jgi:hypothetical protein